MMLINMESNWWNKMSKTKYNLSGKYLLVIIIVISIIRMFLDRSTAYPSTSSNQSSNELGNFKAVSLGSIEETCLNNETKVARENIQIFLDFLRNPISMSNVKSQAVKKKFIDKEKVEHMWVHVDSYKEGKFFGTLDNTPIDVKNIKNGDPVVVTMDEVEDWVIVSMKNDVFGIEAGLYSERCFK